MLSVIHSRNTSMDRNTKSIFVSGVKREVSAPTVTCFSLIQEEMHLFKILQNNIHMTYINGIGGKKMIVSNDIMLETFHYMVTRNKVSRENRQTKLN